MCKQLNRSFLKSLKSKLSGPKSEKKLAGPKFCILFRAGPKFKFLFQTRSGTNFFSLFRIGPKLQPCGPDRAWKIRPVPTSRPIPHNGVELQMNLTPLSSDNEGTSSIFRRYKKQFFLHRRYKQYHFSLLWAVSWQATVREWFCLFFSYHLK